MVRTKLLENDPLFFSMKREKGIARKIFDHIFKRKIDTTLLEEWFEKNQLQFSRYSLNKTSLLMYEQNLNIEENSLNFIFLSFLFEIEKNFRHCISLNEISEIIGFSLEEFKGKPSSYFESKFQLPISYELESIYFKRSYLAEVRLATSICHFQKKCNIKEEPPSTHQFQNIFNQPLHCFESYCEKEDLKFIQEILFQSSELNDEVLIITPNLSSLNKIQFFSETQEINHLKTFSDVSYTIKENNFKKNFQIVILYEAHGLDLFQLDFLFFHFQNIKSLILIGNLYKDFYEGKFIFSQIFQFKQFANKIANYCRVPFQKQEIENILNQVKENKKINFLHYEKHHLQEINQGFHFVDTSQLENTEQFIHSWIEKFKNQKSVVLLKSIYESYFLNEKIREIYKLKKESIDLDEPVIFTQNDLESNFYKGHFTKYKHSLSKYQNLMQTAYVIGLDLAFSTDWENVCLFLKEDDFSIENLNTYSTIISILFKISDCFTLLTNKTSLKYLLNKNLGTSNLIDRVRKNDIGVDYCKTPL